MKMRSLVREQVMCDIELYFWLNSEQNEWVIPVEDAYCIMSGVTQGIFEELLQEYTMSENFHIVEKKQNGTRIEYKIEKFDRSNLLQRTIG